MSFNSCTLNSLTVNSLCGSRRALIISALLPIPPVVSGAKSHPYHSRKDYAREQETFDPRTIESIILSVQVEMNGETQSQMIEMKNDIIPMLSISKFTCENEIVETLNISNITVRAL